MRNVTEIQQRLQKLGYLPVGEDDGKFGQKSLDAYNHWRASKGAGPVNAASMSQLNIDLFPEEQPGATPRLTPNPVVQAIGALAFRLLLNRLSKGLIPMTSEQIGGVIRAILTFLAGLAVAKGWVDNATALTIVGALVTIATAAWSVFTNRPANIAAK